MSETRAYQIIGKLALNGRVPSQQPWNQTWITSHHCTYPLPQAPCAHRHKPQLSSDRYKTSKPRRHNTQCYKLRSIRASISNVPRASIMSDSEPDSPPGFGANSRRRTWDTGDTSAPPLVKAKTRLRQIIRDEIIVHEPTYKYKELASSDEIRVLRILSGGPKDKIECSLIPSALASSTKKPSTSTAKTIKYQALSYWWGDGEPNKEIIINSYGRQGSPSDKDKWNQFERDTFYIRPNLEAALRQIRSPKKEVDIWVDAICINQENKKEKAAQVSMMNEVYTEAESVCIWLGAGKPKTSATFAFLKEILDLERLDHLIKTEQDADKWMLIVELMENRWFSRRWVIQELALARRAVVRWGEDKLPWSKFADAIALFMTKHDEIKGILRRKMEYPQITDVFGDARALGANTLVNATNNLFRKSEDGKIQQRLLTLEVLVSCHFLAFEAKDPRDTIFAVLSIAKDTSFAITDLAARTSWMIKSRQSSNGLYSYCKDALFRWLYQEPVSEVVEAADDIRIAPDYDKCLVDVCADFMDYCIEKSHSLDIICRHWAPLPQQQTARDKLKPGAETEEVEKLPSWIPSVKGHAFGTPEDALQGRSNGDSFVGTIERPHQHHYNASANLPSWAEFGRNSEPEETEVTSEAVMKSIDLGGPKLVELDSPRPRKFDGTLRVKGCRLGTVENLTGRISQGMIQHEAFKMCGLNLASQSHPNQTAATKEVPDQLWRTLVADRGPNGINAPSWYHRACFESLKHVDQNGDLNTYALKTTPKTPSTIISFLDRVQNVVWNRKFFQSEAHGERKPLFGLAPQDTKIKDIICIIFGCSVPVMLRECATPDNTYFELVGECYVHGYMDGEAIHHQHRPKYPYHEAIVFNLR